MRSQFMRCFAALAMIPILFLGTLGGATLLAHAHDGHAIHFHIAPSPEKARLSAQHHRLVHAQNSHACDQAAQTTGHHEHVAICDHSHSKPQLALDSTPHTLPDSDSLIITLPDQEPITLRATHLIAFDLQSQVILLTTILAWSPPSVSQETGSPGGSLLFAPPRHLSELSTSQRLVRVNCALLI